MQKGLATVITAEVEDQRREKFSVWWVYVEEILTGTAISIHVLTEIVFVENYCDR